MAVTNLRTISNDGHIYVDTQARLPADAVDHFFWVAPSDGYSYTVSQIQAIWTTSDSTATTATLMVERCQGTEAPGSGDDLLSAGIDASAAANTVVAASLTATTANLTLAAGDRLALDVIDGVTELAGLLIVVKLTRN